MTNPAAGVPYPRPPDGGLDAVTAGLTPEQAAAVHHGRGPLLLVAGPGTGKTRTLTHRVAYLLASGRAATFHSVCARLLREHAGTFGRTDSYTIYDQADLRRAVGGRRGAANQLLHRFARARCRR